VTRTHLINTQAVTEELLSNKYRPQKGRENATGNRSLQRVYGSWAGW
jgi:hypothetical protein